VLGVDRLDERVARLEARLRVYEPGGWERSRERWRSVHPDEGLTWGRQLDGSAFVAKAREYNAFGHARSVLEIGPGYGRLPAAALEQKLEFGDYLGVDISPANVDYLRSRFDDPRLGFMVADVENLSLDRRFDTLISSLTFKHLFPSFEAALRTCVVHLRPQAIACFDLLEGNDRIFEDDGVTYIRSYSRDEIVGIVSRAGMELVDFTYVKHDLEHERLLTVARKR
jgi:SAM-dependent methyltransferase